MPIAHMDFMWDCTCQHVGPNWATCARPILTPALFFYVGTTKLLHGLKYVVSQFVHGFHVGPMQHTNVGFMQDFPGL